MVSYIDDYKDRYGVEPICRVLPIAPSTDYETKARQRDPERRAPRAIRDEREKPRSSGSGKRTTGFTAPARSGSSSIVKGSRWRAARWHG